MKTGRLFHLTRFACSDRRFNFPISVIGFTFGVNFVYIFWEIDSVVNHCHGVHATSYAIRPLKGNEMFEPSIDFQKICLFSRYKHNLFKTIDEMENLQGCTCKHVLKNDQATCKDRSSLVQLAPNWEVFSPLQKISCSFTWKKLDKGNVFVLPGKWTDSGKLT